MEKQNKIMTKNKYWVRQCKTKGCCGLAKPLSDYCKQCHKKKRR